VTPDNDPERSKHVVISDVVQNKKCVDGGIQEMLNKIYEDNIKLDLEQIG
jgi:hypothetical protein